MVERWLRSRRLAEVACLAAFLLGAGLAPATAASAGLAVVIGNQYDGFLPGSPRDANAIADKLEAAGFATVRLIDATGGAATAGMVQIREAATSAGPLRIVYASGFGMCLNDDLMLFAEDMDPDQFKSGQLGDAAIPLSVVAAAAAEGGSETLLVFDTTPNQCTGDAVRAVKLPGKSALMVTTGIGGDVLEEVDETGGGAFATAFGEAFAPDLALKEIVARIVERIPELTDGQQQPMLVGEL
jgi:hypothetical protein